MKQPQVQISVEVASNQKRLITLMAEVTKGFILIAMKYELVDPKLKI